MTAHVRKKRSSKMTGDAACIKSWPSPPGLTMLGFIAEDMVWISWADSTQLRINSPGIHAREGCGCGRPEAGTLLVSEMSAHLQSLQQQHKQQQQGQGCIMTCMVVRSFLHAYGWHQIKHVGIGTRLSRPQNRGTLEAVVTCSHSKKYRLLWRQ